MQRRKRTSAKRGRGRPRKPGLVHLHVKVQESTKTALAARARIEKREMGDVVREALLRLETSHPLKKERSFLDAVTWWLKNVEKKPAPSLDEVLAKMRDMERRAKQKERERKEEEKRGIRRCPYCEQVLTARPGRRPKP